METREKEILFWISFHEKMETVILLLFMIGCTMGVLYTKQLYLFLFFFPGVLIAQLCGKRREKLAERLNELGDNI